MEIEAMKMTPEEKTAFEALMDLVHEQDKRTQRLGQHVVEIKEELYKHKLDVYAHKL